MGQDLDDDDTTSEETAIGFWSAFAWLAGMAALIALLSEYVVGTIVVTYVQEGRIWCILLHTLYNAMYLKVINFGRKLHLIPGDYLLDSSA